MMAREHLEKIRNYYREPPAPARPIAQEDLLGRYLSKVIDPAELRNKRILEVGAGCSQYASVFFSHGCSEYVANDLMPDRLALARVNDARYRELPGDFLAVDVGADFDIVFANLTMMYVVPMFQEFAARIAAVLKEGGLFLSMDPNYYCPLSLVRRLRGVVRGTPERLFSPHRYARHFIDHGFEVERLTPFTAGYLLTTGSWLLGTNFWLRARKSRK